jgi:hypothetical protein
MKKLLVLVSMALVVAVLVAAVAGSFGQNSPAVYASRVARISAAGETGIQVQNLDQSDQAAVAADFYRSRGAHQATIQVGNVPPMSAANIWLPDEDALPTGAYAAIINADKQIAAIARTDWKESKAAAIYSNVLPGMEISLPLAVREFFGQSSLVSIQNTDQTAEATARVQLYESGSPAAAFDQSYNIPPGTSITLDLGADLEFNALGEDWLGSATISSATEIGVQSFVDVTSSEKAVYAFEGVPSEMASDVLYAPLFRANQLANPRDPNSCCLDTGISVVNPGTSPVQVTIDYYGADHPDNAGCRNTTATSPEVTIQPKSSHVFYQGTPGAQNLQPNCFGSARINATGGGVVAIVNDAQNGSQTAAAFNAVTAAQGATTVALPLYRRGHVGLTTGISVMNVGSESANVTVAFTPNGASQPVACTGCSATVAPNATAIFWPPSLQGVPDGSFGSATIQSSQPVAVIVNDFSTSGAIDMATYNGIKADVQ